MKTFSKRKLNRVDGEELLWSVRYHLEETEDLAEALSLLEAISTIDRLIYQVRNS